MAERVSQDGKLEEKARRLPGRLLLWARSGCGRYMAVQGNKAFSGRTRADAEGLGYDKFGIDSGWTIKESYQYVVHNRDAKPIFITRPLNLTSSQ